MTVFAVTLARSAADDFASICVFVPGGSASDCEFVPMAYVHHRHHDVPDKQTLGSVARPITSCGAVSAVP